MHLAFLHPTPAIFVQAVFLVFGLVWCRAALRNWRTDLAELRATRQPAARLGIALPWIVTAVVALWTAAFLLTLARGFGVL